MVTFTKVWRKLLLLPFNPTNSFTTLELQNPSYDVFSYRKISLILWFWCFNIVKKIGRVPSLRPSNFIFFLMFFALPAKFWWAHLVPDWHFHNQKFYNSNIVVSELHQIRQSPLKLSKGRSGDRQNEKEFLEVLMMTNLLAFLASRVRIFFSRAKSKKWKWVNRNWFIIQPFTSFIQDITVVYVHRHNMSWLDSAGERILSSNTYLRNETNSTRNLQAELCFGTRLRVSYIPFWTTGDVLRWRTWGSEQLMFLMR